MKYRWLQVCLVALALAVFAVTSLDRHTKDQPAAPLEPRRVDFRTAVLILDSVGVGMAFDPTLMPFVASLRDRTLHGEARACPSNATFPCIKTLFEGHEASLGTTLQNFSASASLKPNWPMTLSSLGLRLVVASDNTLNRLYPEAWSDSFNYELAPGHVLEKDALAFERAFQWLSEPRVDVLVVHEIGTDKVSHERVVNGPEYRQKFLEVDQFVARLASGLGPRDYLFLIGDHGHNKTGGHERDAAYLALGPLFPEGKRLDLSATDMLALLSFPYGVGLPPSFRGELHTSALDVAPEQRAAWLAGLAPTFGVGDPGGADARARADQLEAAINRAIAQRRGTEGRETAKATLLTLLPWLLAGAVLLLSLLDARPFERFVASRDVPDRYGMRDHSFGALLIAVLLSGFAAHVDPQLAWAAPLSALVLLSPAIGWRRLLRLGALLLPGFVAVFYGIPSWLGRWHQGQNRVTGVLWFFGALAVAALVWVLGERGRPLRQRLERALFAIALGTWFASVFGVYFYSLTRLGPIALLAGLALAGLAYGRLRAFTELRALPAVFLLPMLKYEAESYNITFTWLTELGRAPASLQHAAVSVFVLGLGALTAETRRGAVRGALALGAWSLAAVHLLEFELTQVIAFLCAGLGLSGLLAFVRRSELPRSWAALSVGVCLFLASWVAFQGFALSRVDFRFAASWVYPTATESVHAAQLVVWAWIKYALVWVPCAFATSVFRGSRLELMSSLVQLSAWRLISIVLSSLGLWLFGSIPGVHELASEEIYYWGWFSLVVWSFALVVTSVDLDALRARFSSRASAGPA